MYKLIAVDLDGTLLDDNRQVSPGNRQAIQDILSAGKIFTVSTGRPVQGIKTIADMIDADLPFIVYNGAMVITSKTNQVLYESVLSGQLAAEVVRFGQARDTNVFVYKNGTLFVSQISQSVKEYMSVIDIMPVVTNDLAQIAAQGVTKVLLRDTQEKIDSIQNEARAKFGNEMNYYTSQPILLEFVDRNTSKGTAMQKIGAHFGIAQSEMIAIGDGYNDVDMIRYAGLGIAMENAPQEVKDAADAITLSNEEDGVAEAIYRYMLKANIG